MANEVTITWTIALLIASVLTILVTQMFSKKASTRKTFLWIGGIGAILMVSALLFSSSLPESLAFLSTPIFGKTVNIMGTDVTYSQVPTSASPTIDGKCIGIEDTTVTLSASNKFTSVATGGTHKYRINGNPALTVTDAGTLTASPGDKIEILWFNSSLTGAYYSVVDSVVVPCSGTKTFSKELIQNGSVTFEVFNEEGNLINGVAENETLAAGDVVTLEAKLKGQYQRGVPYGGVIVAEYNKSTTDDVVVDFGGSKVSTPQTYSITFGADSSTKAYSVPAIISNQILSGSIVIDTDDTINPSDSDSDVILTFYPSNPYVNDDNGGAFEGPSVEDEDNVRTYNSNYASTVSID